VEGAAPQVPDARGFDAQGPDATVPEVGGSGDADAEADADAGDAEADADADADTDEEAGTYAPPVRSTDGTPEPTPFPEPLSREPSGAAGAPPSRASCVVVTVPTAFAPSGGP
jgi:hypothetical protein